MDKKTFIFILIIAGIFILVSGIFILQQSSPSFTQQLQTVDRRPLPPTRLPAIEAERVLLSELAAMTESQFKMMQGKLEFFGPQDVSISPLSILTGYDFEAIEALDHGVGRFDKLRTSGFDYPSSYYADILVLDPQIFKAMIGRINTLSLFSETRITARITTEPYLPLPYLSFALLHITQKKGYEIILNEDEAKILVTAMREAIMLSRVNWTGLSRFACAAGLLSEKQAVDVTAKISVSTTPPRLIPEKTYFSKKIKKPTPRYESIATLTNFSPETIVGPISLVVAIQETGGIIGDLYLPESDGETCIFRNLGKYYINVPLPDKNLQPDQGARVSIIFTKLDAEPIVFSTHVVAGEGEQ